MPLTARRMKSQVERYFAAVDAGDVAAIAALLTPGAQFAVMTGGVRYRGRRAIERMFVDRFAQRARGWHGDFTHAADPAGQVCATRFRVHSVDRDGTVFKRRNINFFEFRDGRIHRIQIWMDGASMLK